MKRGAKPPERASRQKMGEAIDAVLAAVEAHYCRVTTAHELGSRLGDPESLLYVLRDGVEARQDEMRRLRTKPAAARRVQAEAPI